MIYDIWILKRLAAPIIEIINTSLREISWVVLS